MTDPKVSPETKTPWQRLHHHAKREAVRALVEGKGRTYTQAATMLGTTRVAIAGVVERSRRSGNPIVTSSGMQYGGNYRARARWPNGAKGVAPPKPKAPPKAKPKPKLKHAGLHRYVALPFTPPPVDAAPARAGVWEVLPGATPVSIEDHKEGQCRWIHGGEPGHPWMYCGEPVKGAGVYCSQHTALAYREPPPAKHRTPHAPRP